MELQRLKKIAKLICLHKFILCDINTRTDRKTKRIAFLRMELSFFLSLSRSLSLSLYIYIYTYTHMQVYSVAQSCPTLCDPMNCSPPGSPVHGISQARILEWVSISYSNCVRIFPFLDTLFLQYSIYMCVHIHTHTHTHTHTLDLWPSDTGEQWGKDQYGAGTTNNAGTVGQPLL